MRVSLYLLFPLFALCVVSRADAQWVRLSGPGGAYAFTVNGQNIYAGSFGQGVFVSTDEGTDWTAIDSGLTSTDVFALASSGTYLYAGTFLDGMFVSSNSGLTWAPSDSGLLMSSVISLTTYGSDILAGTYANGLFISADSGAIWTPTRLQNLSVYAFAAVGSGMCAGTYGAGWFFPQSAIRRGVSWTAASPPITCSRLPPSGPLFSPERSGEGCSVRLMQVPHGQPTTRVSLFRASTP